MSLIPQYLLSIKRGSFASPFSQYLRWLTHHPWGPGASCSIAPYQPPSPSKTRLPWSCFAKRMDSQFPLHLDPRDIAGSLQAHSLKFYLPSIYWMHCLMELEKAGFEYLLWIRDENNAWWQITHMKYLNKLWDISDQWYPKSCPTLVTPWTVACQSPLSMGFSRQEY